MHLKGLHTGIVLRKSPFLVVKKLSFNEVRVYSKLHGNLTSFDFDITQLFDLFDSPLAVEDVGRKVSEIGRCDAPVLIQELYEKRFLVDADKTREEMFSEYIEAARIKNRIPRISKVTFLVSEKCNMACVGCYHSFYDFKSAAMSSEFAEEILEGLFPYLKKRGIPALLISFLGYEPLLNFDTLRMICGRASAMGDEYGINTTFKLYTNGFSINEEMFEWIEQNRSRFAVMVSLDGIREDNDKRRTDSAGMGTYDAVVRNLKRIIVSGVECGVITVLGRWNLANIEKFVKEMNEAGVKTITANMFCGQSEEERLMELTDGEKIEAVKRMDLASEKYGIEFNGEWKFPVVQMVTGARLFCPAGTKQLVFGADGAIYPCQRFAGTEVTLGAYGPDFWEELTEGRCGSYNQWTTRLYNGMAERTKEDKTDFTGCVCPFIPFIRGECITRNLTEAFDESLVQFYLTRPLNRILTKSPLSCYN